MKADHVRLAEIAKALVHAGVRVERALTQEEAFKIAGPPTRRVEGGSVEALAKNLFLV